MRTCIYCGHTKEDKLFTKEHVIPRALGGNITPQNPFLSYDVCQTCNTRCGLYIDAPFVKNWTVKNFHTEAIYQYLDLSKDLIMPLRYIGPLNDMREGTKICELWIGPTGDTIYHFHEPYPEEPDIPPMVGPAPHLKKDLIDPGYAFIFVRASNPKWHKLIFYSFIDQFKDSILYLGNGPTPKGGRFSDIPTSLSPIYYKLKTLVGKMHKCDLKMNVHYGDRFLTKLAIGLGSIYLKDSFRQSGDIALLQRFLWTKKSEERENIPIHGSSFLSGRIQIPDVFSFSEWTHTISFMNLGNAICLWVSFFGDKQRGAIQITEDISCWPDDFDQEGVVFIVAPGLQRCIGPISLPSYIGHQLKVLKNDELSMLAMEMESKRKELPPFDAGFLHRLKMFVRYWIYRIFRK